MSIKEFKELYTILSCDVRAQPAISLLIWTFTVNIAWKAVRGVEILISDNGSPTNPKEERHYIIVYIQRRANIKQKLNKVSMSNSV